MKPDEFVRKVYLSINIRYRVTFISSLLLGLCAHLYQFTNKLFNYDELGNMPDGIGTGTALGRWGLELLGSIVGKLFGTYSLPMVNGALTLLMIAVSACLLVGALDIRDYVFCALIGGVCAVFPTVTCTYFFMYTAPYYGVALLCSSFSGYLIVRGKKSIISYLTAIVSLAFSTSLYQAYYPVAVCLVIISMAVLLYEADASSKEILCRGVYYLLYLLFGVILYLIINKNVVRMSDVVLSSYQNVEHMGRIEFNMIGEAVSKCYSSYFSMMRPIDVYQINPTILTKISFLILNVLLMMIIFLNLFNQRKTLFTRILLVFSMAVFPLGMFMIYLMAPDSYVYTLMVYPCVFAFLFPIALCDRMEGDAFREIGKSILQKITIWMSVILTSLCVFIYIWFANGNYQALQYTNYHDLAYFTVIMTQVKSIDGYDQNMPVAVVGEKIEDVTNQAGALISERFNITGKLDSNIASYANGNILGKYLGFTPIMPSWEEIKRLARTEEVMEMPCYPDDGSIQIIGENVIVKLSDDFE